MGLLLGIIGIITFIALLAAVFGIPYFLFLNYKNKLNGDSEAIS